MFQRIAILLAAACAAAAPALAGEDGMVNRRVAYQAGDTACEGVLVYDGSAKADRPGVVMFPNWMGVTPEAVAKAERIAGDDRVVFVADMYGRGVRPENTEEASAAAAEVRGDRPMMRRRAAAALEAFRARAEELPLRRSEISAIGFCFGGGVALEFGRAGAGLDAIVSFHGDLASPTLERDAGATGARVLVLHGADDPYVPQEDVRRFVDAMRATDVDWRLVQFGNTVHSFTDRNADAAGKADYNARSARRAYAMMEDLFDRVHGAE